MVLVLVALVLVILGLMVRAWSSGALPCVASCDHAAGAFVVASAVLASCC